VKPHTYAIEHDVSASHWWFSGRRAVLAALLDGLPLPRPARILDAGCGTGSNLPVLVDRGAVVGVDAGAAPLAFAAAVPRARARLEALPFADVQFDLVTALDILEHLDDDVAGARELARVVRPGGWLVVFVPAFRFLWSLQDEVSEHRRRYTRPELVTVLERAGLSVQRSSYFNTILFPPILLGRLALRIRRPAIASENVLTSPVLDRILGRIFAAEGRILGCLDLPVGVSVLAIARRR
jgi:SAM-dependent methyltransferase